MCYGALFWCGVRRLVCGARASDTERAGFDEGAKVENWQDELRQRGIDVVTDIHRDRTVAVLMEYAKACGAVDDVRAAC